MLCRLVVIYKEKGFAGTIGIIENNISTKFGDNRTNFGGVITISCFQCFRYSSGHNARGTSIVSTLLSLKKFSLEVRS